jgi:4a-hydroxytetrahydrobiopterin dehydratase
MTDLKHRKCKACRPDAPKATVEEIETYSKAIPEWKMIQDKGLDKLVRSYPTKKYADTLKLVNGIAELSEQEGHHPVMLFEFRQLTVHWWSHEMNGLHVNDFICAAKCDEVFEGMQS